MSNELDARGCGELAYLRDETQWVRTYPLGRVCAATGCTTTLSVYNPTRYCGAHQPEPDMRYYGQSFGICEDCGAVISVRRDRPSRVCKMCSNERQREAMRKLNAERRGVFEPDRIKTCPVCGEQKPMTTRHWSIWTRPDGTETTYRQCRECRNKAQRDRYQKAKGNS